MVFNSLFSVCPELEVLAYGEIVLNYVDRREGTIAKYFCDVGYVLVGDATRCCVQRVFSGRLVWRREYPPTCVRKLHYLVFNSFFL